MGTKRRHASRRKIVLSVIAAILCAGIAVAILEATGATSLFSSRESTSQDTEASTTSAIPSAQPDFNGGTDKDPGNTLTEQQGSAVIKDQSGSIGESVDQNSSITSTTGEVTVYSPAQNTVVKSGLVVAGRSTLQSVKYRIIDSVSGMIAMGELRVVNGQFSGELSIETAAREGRLDLYGMHIDGSEFSNVEINLRFNQ